MAAFAQPSTDPSSGPWSVEDVLKQRSLSDVDVPPAFRGFRVVRE